MIYWASKGPADAIDYGMAWGPTLSKLGDPPPVITVASWEVVRGDVTIQADIVDADGRGTTARIAGGTDGTEAIVRNYVTLDDGQSFHEEAFLKIRSL